jgi:LAO/AO transport system kinase
MELAARVMAGDERALARAISTAEEDAEGAPVLLRAVFPRTGRATVVGITGPPGSGKSSLVDALIARHRAEGRRVGVVAVDPSSAFSGGAILGDRVRMQKHATDAGVFIRSMATRGHLGGLSRTANDAVDLLDAAGYDPILVETVGVGQDEVEVARSADVVAVVLVPGMGDDIQAIKAGILEIADLFVVNKADRPGADRLAADLEAMLALAPDGAAFRPEILRTVAVRGEGVGGLQAGIVRFLQGRGAERRAARRRERAEARFLALLREQLLERVVKRVLSADEMEETVSAIAERRIDPYAAAERVLRRVEVR